MFLFSTFYFRGIFHLFAPRVELAYYPIDTVFIIIISGQMSFFFYIVLQKMKDMTIKSFLKFDIYMRE